MDNQALIRLLVVAALFANAAIAQTVIQPHVRVSQVQSSAESTVGGVSWSPTEEGRVYFRGDTDVFSYYYGYVPWAEGWGYNDWHWYLPWHRTEWYSYAEWPALDEFGWQFENWWSGNTYYSDWVQGVPGPLYQYVEPWGRCTYSYSAVQSESGFTWEDTAASFREVRVELVTGGTAGETYDNNLFRLMVSADDGFGAVPSQEITVSGKTLRPDGSVYKKFPDHAYVDATPVINEPCYTYAAGVQKAKLLIMRGAQDITHQTTTVWVGERVDLQCVLSVGIAAFGNPTIEGYSWTIPGNKIKGWDANASQSTLTPFPASDLQNSSVMFYWVDGHNEAVVQCTMQVAGETVTTQAKFTVVRPNATLGAEILSNVAVDNLWQDTFGRPALHFGSALTSVGIRFSYNTDGLGSYQYVQTGNAMRAFFRELDNRWYVAQGNGLDTYYPYPKQTINNNETQRAVDSPGMGPLSQHLEYMAGDNFEMHLMFKANVTGAIWVPLRKRWWNWNGDAVLISGEYVLVSDKDPAFGGDTESTDYPSWNSNLFDGIDDISDFIPQ